MGHTIRLRVLVLTALLLGLGLSMPGAVGAKATRTAVAGVADLSEDILGGDIRTDGADKLHFHQVIQTGHIALWGEGITIDGIQTVVLNGTLNQDFTGPFAGIWTVRTLLAGQETVIWQGHIHGQVVELVFHGRITAQGQGPFAGMLLRLTIEEDTSHPEDPVERFTLIGWLLDPQGQ